MSDGEELKPGDTYLTDWAVTLVEAGGSDFAATLLVSGVIITGYITSWKRQHRWQLEVLVRASHEGGHGEIPTSPPPDFPELRKRDAAEWRGQYGTNRVTVDRFCVADAEVRSGMRPTWIRVPFLVVNAAAVGAMSIGFSRYDLTESDA